MCWDFPPRAHFPDGFAAGSAAAPCRGALQRTRWQSRHRRHHDRSSGDARRLSQPVADSHAVVREARRGCSGAMTRPDSRGRALAGLPHSSSAPVSPLAPSGTSVQARPFQIDLEKVSSAVLTVGNFFYKPAKGGTGDRTVVAVAAAHDINQRDPCQLAPAVIRWGRVRAVKPPWETGLPSGKTDLTRPASRAANGIGEG
jgi:hypothetical protein